MDEQQPVTSSTYVSHVAATLWENLPHLLWGALIFSLACAPVFVLFSFGLLAAGLLAMAVVVGPVWAALQAYSLRMAGGYACTTGTFFTAFRQHWRGGALLGLLALFPWMALLTTLPLLQQNPIPFVVWLGLSADFLGIAVMLALSLYTFPLLIQRGISVRAAVRDALILTSRYPSNTLGLLALGILFGFAAVYLSLGLLFILPAVYSLFIATNSLLVLSQEA